MTKLFDAAAIQAKLIPYRGMIGVRFKHYKGAEYVVTGIDVDEATGELRVSYWGIDSKHYWSRPLAQFTEVIPGVGERFTRIITRR